MGRTDSSACGKPRRSRTKNRRNKKSMMRRTNTPHPLEDRRRSRRRTKPSDYDDDDNDWRRHKTKIHPVYHLSFILFIILLFIICFISRPCSLSLSLSHPIPVLSPSSNRNRTRWGRMLFSLREKLEKNVTSLRTAQRISNFEFFFSFYHHVLWLLEACI